MRFPGSRSLSRLPLWAVLGASVLSLNAPHPALAQDAPAQSQGYEPPEISVEEFVRMVGEPTRVDFSGQDVTPQVAATALLVAANLPSAAITPDNPPGVPKTISVNWKNTSFWDAAREIERLTGLRWSGPRDLPLYPITLQPVYNEPDKSLNGEVLAQLPCLRFTCSPTGGLGLYLDPKLSATMAYVKDLEGVPAGYNTILGTMVQGKAKVAGGNVYSRGGKMVVPASGLLHLHVFSSMESLHIANFEVGASTTLPDGSASLMVRDASFEDGELKIQLTLRRPHGPLSPIESSLSMDYLTVTDGAGNLLRRANSSTGPEEGKPNAQSEWVDVFFKSRKGTEAPKGPFSIDWVMPKEERCVNIPIGKP